MFRRACSLCCRLCGYVLIFILVLIALGFAYFHFYVVVPGERARIYEEYVKSLFEQRGNGTLVDNRPLPKHFTHPLIRDVPQLWSDTRHDQLGLIENIPDDDTLELWGKYSEVNTQQWVYVGGTNPGPDPWYVLPTLYTRYNGSCVDEPQVCEAYNAAFETIAAEVKRHSNPDIAGMNLSFADCDVAGGICNSWGMNPAMLAHFRVMQPCRFRMSKPMGFICSVKVSHVSLPLATMPYIRKVRIGPRLVPAFPSHYEQLRTLIMFDGSVDGLDEDSVTRIEFTADPNADYSHEFPKVELGEQDHWLAEIAIGGFQGLAQRYMSLREAVLG